MKVVIWTNDIYLIRRALKRLKFTGSEDEKEFAKREIELLKKINHVNIVKYLDSFVKVSKDCDENETFQCFIVTDYYKVNL